MHDFDLLVVGHETEGVLAAVAAARAGARVGLVAPPGRWLGGLLTEGGLAYVDRDSRHLVPPGPSSQDGIFGSFLARAGVQLVALDPAAGVRVLAEMLAEGQIPVLRGRWSAARTAGDRLCAIKVGPEVVTARNFVDATADGDLLEALGERFVNGFDEFGRDRRLAVSPLPRVRGVTAQQIFGAAQDLACDPDLAMRKERVFGARRFLELEQGVDYLLIGPPHLALAFARWREREGLVPPLPFEADGFNVAILGPADTVWNGLLYSSTDPAQLLDWSRCGADDRLIGEVRLFERWLREDLGWTDAEVSLPAPEGPFARAADGAVGYRGVYVRQTRHLLGTRLRFSLSHIVANAPVRSVGTFCYYPDFRGFGVTPTTGPLVARVALDAGLPLAWRNVAIASRAAGYTPQAHSLCRLIQYNVTLAAALGVASALSCTDLADAEPVAICQELARLGILANDPAGVERNIEYSRGLAADPLFRAERPASFPTL
ncbi:MAG: FAD-dependent oxidoreductase [Cyanobacteria bacterium REEB65]|nr:FAD-dependent oxidoreductase [Cyanobacteria bacterium REEB65]